MQIDVHDALRLPPRPNTPNVLVQRVSEGPVGQGTQYRWEPIRLEMIGEGTRVRIYRIITGAKPLNGRALRIPINPEHDKAEITQTEILSRHFHGLLPQPSEVDLLVNGMQRRLVTADVVSTRQNTCFMTANNFRTVLNGAADLHKAMAFLQQTKALVDGCKELYNQYRRLPDFVGHGNIVIKDEHIFILDFNNIIYDHVPTNRTPVVVPLDDKGFPVFDLSLRLIYHIETMLLSVRYDEAKTQTTTGKIDRRRTQPLPEWSNPGHHNCVRSTNAFDRLLHTAVPGSYEPSEVARFLSKTLRPFSQIQNDKFYRALRLKARREAVDKAFDWATRFTKPPF